MAWNKWVDRFVRPLFDLIRPIPGLAWIPMFILLFGIGITSKALVIFLGGVDCLYRKQLYGNPADEGNSSLGG